MLSQISLIKFIFGGGRDKCVTFLWVYLNTRVEIWIYEKKELSQKKTGFLKVLQFQPKNSLNFVEKCN